MHARPRRAASRRHDHGASAVEFALVSMLLFTLVFGIVQYGLYFWQLQGGAAAAREAARQSAVGRWDCTSLRSESTARVPAGGSDVTVTRGYVAATGGAAMSKPSTGDDVRVTISFATPTIGMLPMPNAGTVVSEARARVETVTAASQSCM